MTLKEHRIAQIVLPGLIGNILAWYDFALYGYFAAIISPLFFPSTDIVFSLMATFAVFAVGFFMRPLGAILFGHLGDRYGRKNALTVAILWMAIPTALMGCLPTHAQIGVWAGIFLTVLRLLQGLAVGGEFTGSIVYICEHAPAKRRGFLGSLVMSSAFAGLVLGSGAAALTSTYFANTQWETFAWRVPFWAGLVLGGVGIYLRIKMPESPIFTSMVRFSQSSERPVPHAFQRNWRKMCVAAGIIALPSLAFYLSFVYLTTHLAVYLAYPLSEALKINTLTMSLIMLIIPFCGHLSDRFGRKTMMRTGAIGFIMLSYPAYLLLAQSNFMAIFIAQLCFAVLVALSYAAVPAALVEYFPAQIRSTGLSVPYNLANAIFGGTAPFIATFCIYLTGKVLSPSYVLIFGAMITLLSLRFLPETRGRAIDAN